MNDFDKRNKAAKGTVIVIIIILIVMLLFGSLMFFTFRTVGDEEDEIASKVLENVKNQAASSILGLSDFKKLRGATAEVKEQVQKENALASTSKPSGSKLENVSIRGNASEQEKLVNELSYAIAAEAFEKVKVSNWPEPYRDPLILMAQASTESLTIANLKVSYSSAIPTAGVRTENFTEDYFLSFNTAKAYHIPEMVKFQAGNKGFAGMAQFSSTYGVGLKNYDSSILNFSDEKSVVTSDTKALQVKNSTLGRVKLRAAGNKGKTGDRFNWHDVSIQQVAKYDNVMNSKANTEIDKRVTNIYSFTAYIAMMHNIGEGIQTTGPDQPRPSFMKGGGTNTDVAIWAEFLGSDEVVSEIDTIATQIVNDFQTGGNATRHMKADEMLAILKKHGSGIRNYDKYVSILQSKSTQNKEKVMHPAKMLLHYLVLQKHYSSGGGAPTP